MLKTYLRYFMSVARLGSIRAASCELHVAQSAVSRQIQALEYQLGTALLERHARGVALTQAGHLVFAFGQKTEHDTDLLRAEFDNHNGLRRGNVRLVSVESLVAEMLPQAIGRFRQQHSGITFTVDILTSDLIVDAVRDGEADIGICLDARSVPNVEVIASLREPLQVVVSPQHPLARLERVTLQDLADWPLALAPDRSASRIKFEQGCAAAGIKIVPVLETNSVGLMHRFAVLGFGASLAFRQMVAGSVRDKGLVIRELSTPMQGSTLDVLKIADRELSAAAKAFTVALLSELPGAAAPDQPGGTKP